MANSATKPKEELLFPDYPAIFSQIAIPPNDAIDAQGDFFRLVCCVPPAQDCFLSTHEEQPERYLTCQDDESRANVCGTSFFSDRKAVERKRQVFKNVLGARKVAYGTLHPHMGRLKKTGGKAHYTAWLKVGCEVHKFFREAE
ncbi:hypothetical protein [Serratia sp. DD3]|uniref:hypothetical protein n=1 Tax=Serratia sp. DD3 TaxID=1410619 RepID=UPI0004D36009|nr:hypothetical protein [Serratia sp. DD3]KEY58486.1 hypothetical protein SRDD_27330 [Serratia sp. DD3]